MVAIYDNPGIKHWSLFIDVEDKPEKTVIQILGARRHYFRDVKTPSDARILDSLIELRALCEFDATKIDEVKTIAWDTPIRNDESDYSCQDFVLDVLEKLEEQNIIDGASDEYQRNKAAIVAKRESWK